MTVIGHGSDGCTYSLFVEDADKNTKIVAINSELVNQRFRMNRSDHMFLWEIKSILIKYIQMLN